MRNTSMARGAIVGAGISSECTLADTHTRTHRERENRWRLQEQLAALAPATLACARVRLRME